ncbi:MAG: hypothetical protein J6S92_01720 [Oscillospiraceae bacterium]|nr:hypothetical protein [Oscillospiraceae bacterium]
MSLFSKKKETAADKLKKKITAAVLLPAAAVGIKKMMENGTASAILEQLTAKKDKK